MKLIAAVLMLLGIFSALAFANIAKPDNPSKGDPRKAIDTNLSIQLKSDAKEARLIIPRSQVKQLRAALEEADTGVDIASTTAPGSSLGFQTIAGGTFLSLGMIFGGLWFARSRKSDAEQGNVVVALVIAIAFAFGSAMVWANAGP